MEPSSYGAKQGEGSDPLARCGEGEGAEQLETYRDRFLHQSKRHGNDVVCRTDSRGYATPSAGDRSPVDLVLHADDGFIPLWDKDVTLRWRFQEQSMSIFVDPEGAKDYLRDLFGRALVLWTEDALPVRFKEAQDAWDFEIVVNANEDCDVNGCTLASAFFPDGGRHELRIFPTMFDQSDEDRLETIAHEVGHVFGLRHFFALLTETAWPAEIFGDHQRFSIMNYGIESVMTETDRSDLKTLYREAWCGRLTHVNGTPIRLVRPFSHGRVAPVGGDLCPQSF